MLSEWNQILKDKMSHPSTHTLLPGSARASPSGRLFLLWAAFSIHFKGREAEGL